MSNHHQNYPTQVTDDYPNQQESTMPDETSGIEHTSIRRDRLLRALPWLWLALSALWAMVIFMTDQLAWPLALWIATTLGPLTLLQARLNPKEDPATGTNE